MRFLAEEISVNTYINIMDQYRPAHRAAEYPELDRTITRAEHAAAVEAARRHGLRRIDRRSSESWVVRWP